MSERAQTTAAEFPIAETERALLVGRTGSGKSTLARALLSQWAHVVVIDAKGDFDLPHGRVIQDPRELSKIKTRSPAPILYRPRPEFWHSEVYDAVFRWIYERRNTTVYVDEVFAVMDERTARAPHWLNAILTRGRSLKIRTLLAAQRPFRVPLSILSESEHRFMFELNLSDDKKRMAELMGPEVLAPLANEHGFYYYNVKKPGAGVRQYLLQTRSRPQEKHDG